MSYIRKLTIFLYPVSLVLNDLKFIIIGLLFGLIIFTVPDQASDNFVSMFGEENYGGANFFGINFYHVLFWFFIATWTLHVWGCSRVILYVRNYRQFYGMLLPAQLEMFNTRIIRLQRFVPRFLSPIPFFITGMAISKVNGLDGYVIWYLVSGLAAFLFFTFRSNLLRRNPVSDRQRFSMDIHILSRRYKMAMWLFGMLFLSYLLLVTFSIRFSPVLKSMLIVAISINMWTYIFTWLQFFTWKARVSLVLILLLVFTVCSMTNNNHKIRTICHNNERHPPSPVSIEQDCNSFLETNQPDTIYLIAAQGGGIRAAYWTSIVMQYLATNNKDFMKKTYAFSGASGGSLGAAIFLAAWKRQMVDKGSPVLENTQNIFYRHDFLSPLTAAFLGPDVIQKFCPFPVACFDRARYLEKAWEEADSSLYFCQSFYSLFKNVKGYHTHIPLLLLNSTWAETGRRAIIAPVKLSQTEEFQNGSLSLLDSLPHDIRLSTAVSLSARFPFLTPGGVVTDRCNKATGTFTDGGYVDNSGLATLLELKDLVKRLYHDTTQPCIIHMIYIENGDTSITGKNTIGNLYELKTVLSSFYNSWDGQDLALAHKVGTYTTEFNTMSKTSGNPVRLLFSRFSLPHTQDTILPLGWVLSEKAKVYMRNAAVRQGSRLR